VNPEFEGLEGLLSFRDGTPEIGVETAEFVPPPAEPTFSIPEESAGWSWEQWQRFAGVGLLRDYVRSMDAALLGTAAPEVSWEEAEQLYDRAQAEQARMAEQEWRELTRLYWSGPDKFARRVLRGFGVTAQQAGVVPRSAFSGEYRRRQRARVKRRRR
jgi:hypothetical protein